MKNILRRKALKFGATIKVRGRRRKNVLEREKLSINIAAMCCRWGGKNCFKKYEKVEKRDEFHSQFNSISKIVILFIKYRSRKSFSVL